MTTPQEPLPCPFCGRNNRLTISAVPNTNGNTEFVRCYHCEAHGPWQNRERERYQYERWNTRPTLPVSASPATGEQRELVALYNAAYPQQPKGTATPRTSALWLRNSDYSNEELIEELRILARELETAIATTQRELARATAERNWMRSELRSIGIVYCEVDVDKPGQVQGGLTEGLIYAFLEGAFQIEGDKIARAQADFEQMKEDRNRIFADRDRLAAELEQAKQASAALVKAYDAQKSDDDLRNPDAGDAFWQALLAFITTAREAKP